MKFKTLGNRNAPAVLFFHAMGVTGESSEPVAKYLQDRYFCILPTSTVYCKGQKYVSKADEVRQVEAYLKSQGVERHVFAIIFTAVRLAASKTRTPPGKASAIPCTSSRTCWVRK
jgi:hypothetical protein